MAPPDVAPAPITGMDLVDEQNGARILFEFLDHLL